jgi:hypothetical protein
MEAGMTNGLILLVVIAAIVAYVVARAGRRMGLATSSKGWIIVMTVFVLAMLALWADRVA